MTSGCHCEAFLMNTRRNRRTLGKGLILGVLLCAAPAFGQPTRGQATDLRISFIDVGQGDAIWIKTPDTGSGSKNIIIDGGPDRGARNRLTKYLTTYDLAPGSIVDYVIVSHPHDDHYPALLDVLALYKVRTIVDSGYEKGGEYDDFLAAARAEMVNGQAATVVSLRESAAFTIDAGPGVVVRLLHVDSATLKDMGRDNTRENNASTVIRLEMGGFSFLLMGDAEGKHREQSPDIARFVEKELIDKLTPTALRADVLKAGHHGSETGSTLPFLKVVQPRVVVVMSGRRTFNGRSIPMRPCSTATTSWTPSRSWFEPTTTMKQKGARRRPTRTATTFTCARMARRYGCIRR